MPRPGEARAADDVKPRTDERRQGGSKGPRPVKMLLGRADHKREIGYLPTQSLVPSTMSAGQHMSQTTDACLEIETPSDGRRILRSARPRTALPALDLAGPAGGLEATLRSSGSGRVRSQVAAGDGALVGRRMKPTPNPRKRWPSSPWEVLAWKVPEADRISGTCPACLSVCLASPPAQLWHWQGDDGGRMGDR